MGTPLTGRLASIKIGTSSSAVVLSNMGHWEINIAHDELDASDFQTVWKKSMVGKAGWSGSMEGFFDPSTGTSASPTQMSGLLKPSLDGTKIQDIRFHLTATSMFWMPNYTTIMGTYGYLSTDAGCYISSPKITADKNGLTGFSCNVLGYGPIALFAGTSAASVIIESSDVV